MLSSAFIVSLRSTRNSIQKALMCFVNTPDTCVKSWIEGEERRGERMRREEGEKGERRESRKRQRL